MQSGTIRAGMGGWNFAPWEGTFYPDRLPKKRQLEHASRQVSTLEVNGTFYRGQTPETFAKWAAEVPDGFVFSVKGHRAIVSKKRLAEAGESLAHFFSTGVTELGDRLGPLLWQLAPNRTFDPDDLDAFLALLPRRQNGLALRHVLEVRHGSFAVPEFVALLRKHHVALCYAHHASFPEIADVTADFVYARLQKGEDDVPTAYPPAALATWAARAKAWAGGGQPDDLPLVAPAVTPPKAPRDVFVYFIHEGKVRAPHAAVALMKRLGAQPPR